LLYARWDSGVIRESKNVANEGTLTGVLNPASKLELALRNKSSQPISHLVIKLHGNADTHGEPSDHFHGKGDLIEETFWQSTPGTTLTASPKGFGTKDEASEFTTLELGTFSWDRAEGNYWLSITVTGENLSAPVKYIVALEPHLGYG